MKWACPKCGAPAGKHGKGGQSKCIGGSESCDGLICECLDAGEPAVVARSEQANHGTSLANPCPHANCYHCGWGGTVPATPKTAAPWEKKALAAGWTPPAARKKELGV